MSEVSEAIEAAARRWMQAWVNRDAAVLDESLAPDFVLIMSAIPEGRLERDAWLATACTRYLASEFRYSAVQVRQINEDVAVMSSVAEFQAEVDGVPRNGPLFIVDVWRRTGPDRWQVCARYSANPEPAGTAQRVQTLQGG